LSNSPEARPPLDLELLDFIAEAAPQLERLEKSGSKLARPLVQLWQSVFAIEYVLRAHFLEPGEWEEALDAVVKAFERARVMANGPAGTA
jgi:hypothetical protein